MEIAEELMKRLHDLKVQPKEAKWKKGEEWRDKRAQKIKVKTGFLNLDEELKLDDKLSSLAMQGVGINRVVVMEWAKKMFFRFSWKMVLDQ